MSELERVLKESCREYQNILQMTDEKLALLPEGSLRVSRHGKYHQFYLRTPEDLRKKNYNGKYLSTKEKARIAALCQRQYLEKIKNSAEEQLSVLEKCASEYTASALQDIYSSLPEAMLKYIHPVDVPDEEYVRRWEAEEYERKPIAEGTAEFYTSRGERVRSKSEKIIADSLIALGIPYKYEKPLILSGQILIHPDFVILSVSQRREYYLEHFGMMDNPQYAEKAVERVALYERNGIYLGKKLLVSCETTKHPLNMRILQEAILSHIR